MDRVDTLSSVDFSTAEIDWLLNEAQLIYIKQRLSPASNVKKTGFENTQKRIEDLSKLVVKCPVLQTPVTPALIDGVYELDLSTLQYPYLYMVALVCDVEVSENCTKRVPLKEIDHNDYRDSFRDPFNSPSLEFIPYNYGTSSTGDNVSLYMYPFTAPITLVYPEYIRYPARPSYGNYVYIDGITYPELSLETAAQTHPEIVDLACQIASLNIENPEYIRLKDQKVVIHE